MKRVMFIIGIETEFADRLRKKRTGSLERGVRSVRSKRIAIMIKFYRAISPAGDRGEPPAHTGKHFTKSIPHIVEYGQFVSIDG